MEPEPEEPNRSELYFEGIGGTGVTGQPEPVGIGPGIGKWEPILPVGGSAPNTSIGGPPHAGKKG